MAQSENSIFDAMRWRMIGPHRGGRTVGAVGVPQQPNVFYIGVNNGGVWKTTDYGRTWFPIFDQESSGSIGTIAIAPSNPDIIYVGSGEGLQRPDLSVGNGMYRSADAGKTWTHLGLRDGQQIAKIAVDPGNPDKIFVAVLGHPYGPNEERGIYRSTDGGKNFEKVLYTNENVGGDDVTIDPSHPETVYATMWEARQGPWENGAWSGTHGGIYKSTDGGKTWKKIINGLPTNLVQAHLAISPSSPQTIYTVFSTTEPNTYGTGSGMGFYRSDDGGASWKNAVQDGRPEAKIGGGDLPVIVVDAQHPEVLYSASIVLWRSTDGGRSWTGIKGAPGGDDYQNIWINPLHPEIFLLTGDQGACVTVNGGQTFSSWYNQPTAQLYHVAADNAFPYNLYSGQQESGSVGIASRGNDGEITFREWHPVGVEEYGYVAPDPLNPNIIYGGKVSKYDKRTGQTQNISPEAMRTGNYRFRRTEPVVFSPVDHQSLFFAGNVLFKTKDGGNSWQFISPDLTRESWDIPPSVGIYNNEEVKAMKRRGVIYTVAPSYRDLNTIWCGTDDGYIQLTQNGGKTWKNVTPSSITSWSKISIIDAGHFDAQTAYAAVNRIRLDDMHPYIYKTHDGGKTWKEITNGLPADPINVVREDPQHRGLLFAGSETAVYVSFDDGEHWQSLRLNMPATSIRDLIIKEDDLAVATHGRGFWILDDITPIRQLADHRGKIPTALLSPENAYRVRWNTNTDTPLPPEEPAGQNPPDGSIIDYYLGEQAREVALEIRDDKNNLVRRFSSLDTLYKIPELYIPLYWIRPQQHLSTEKGLHRFVWDLHYTPFNEPPSYPIAAVYQNTAPNPSAPWVMPGTYHLKLLVDGKSFNRELTVKMDPRVKTPVKDLENQAELSLVCYRAIQQINQIEQDLNPAQKQSLANKKEIDFAGLRGRFSGLLGLLQESDMSPLSQVVSAVKETQARLQESIRKWNILKTRTE
ncbi:MAG: WD40/YVTN/BNR-like repeat-containing protein [Flavisolibacter sp.]